MSSAGGLKYPFYFNFPPEGLNLQNMKLIRGILMLMLGDHSRLRVIYLVAPTVDPMGVTYEVISLMAKVDIEGLNADKTLLLLLLHKHKLFNYVREPKLF